MNRYVPGVFRAPVLLGCLLVLAVGCASMPEPHEVRVPQPIRDNSGEYLAPYTQDGVVAKWVDKAINAEFAASVGSTVGAAAGQEILENIPIIGGWLGSEAGEMIGRAVAIEASGGWDHIRETSDLSFRSEEDLAVWMYATHSTNEHYAEVLRATKAIYPELKDEYESAIMDARR